MTSYFSVLLGVGSLLSLAACGSSEGEEYIEQCRRWLNPSKNAKEAEWHETPLGTCKVILKNWNDLPELKKQNECDLFCGTNRTLDWDPIEYEGSYYLCSRGEFPCYYDEAKLKRLTDGTNHFSHGKLGCTPPLETHDSFQYIRDIQEMRALNLTKGLFCVKVR